MQPSTALVYETSRPLSMFMIGAETEYGRDTYISELYCVKYFYEWRRALFF